MNTDHRGSKFHLRKLDKTSDEYNFIKGFYDITHNVYGYIESRQLLNIQICKVIENNPMKTADEKRNNLMLFHCTSDYGAMGILDRGFRNSRRGWFGSAIYMTENSHISYVHAVKYNKRACLDKADSFIFVNEVLESEKLQTFEFDIFKVKDHDTPLQNSFNKHIRPTSRQISRENYKKDQEGRLYRNIANDRVSSQDEFVAEASVTIPRYLILVETEKIKKT